MREKSRESCRNVQRLYLVHGINILHFVGVGILSTVNPISNKSSGTVVFNIMVVTCLYVCLIVHSSLFRTDCTHVSYFTNPHQLLFLSEMVPLYLSIVGSFLKWWGRQPVFGVGSVMSLTPLHSSYTKPPSCNYALLPRGNDRLELRRYSVGSCEEGSVIKPMKFLQVGISFNNPGHPVFAPQCPIPFRRKAQQKAFCITI